MVTRPDSADGLDLRRVDVGPAEMLRPFLCARIVERHDLTCARVSRFDVFPLPRIAARARQRKVLQFRQTQQEDRQHVIDRKSRDL